MVDLFNEVERELMWPWQLLCSLVMVTPKPQRGDRALGLLPALFRCWEKLHRGEVQQWSSAQEKEWDTAIA